MTCSYIPPYITTRLAKRYPRLEGTVHNDGGFREVRASAIQTKTHGGVTVYDAKSRTSLPGRSADPALAQALTVRQWESSCVQVFGGADFPDVVVRYGEGYANAFYNGKYLVFGQGDGEIFGDFTEACDVFAHERGHDVVADGPGIEYAGQPGALNEHLADVMGICTMHFRQGHSKDWRLGEELFLDGSSALRDMLFPGSAYSTDDLGDDPQPGHMRDYVVTDADKGGVHINSGIPNRAFALFVQNSGITSWTQPLEIWWNAMSACSRHTDFAKFANLTSAYAGDLREAVRDAWGQVGIATA